MSGWVGAGWVLRERVGGTGSPVSDGMHAGTHRPLLEAALGIQDSRANICLFPARLPALPCPLQRTLSCVSSCK